MISNAMEKSLLKEDKYAAGGTASQDSDQDEDDIREKNEVSKRMLTGKIRVRGAIPVTDKEDSLDSDLDLGEEGEEASDLDSEDELELINLAASRDARAATAVKKPESDDDF